MSGYGQPKAGSRLVEEVLPMFEANSYGFQGQCFSDWCGHAGAVATLVTTDRRGRKTYRAVCDHHAAKHRATS